MKLTKIEKQSALWLKIEAELKERLQILREQNDGDKDAVETARQRGRIAEAKEMLSWADDDPQIM